MTPKTVTVPLDSPILRGETTIAELTLRKPSAGELRGINLAALAQMETDQLLKLIPRISSPSLTGPEVNEMDPADLISCGLEIAGFLLPTRLLREASPTA